MKSVVELMLNIDSTHSKYDVFLFDESNYGSKEEYLSWRNYIKQKREAKEDLLTELVTGAATSAFNAARHVFMKESQKTIERLADEAVKQLVKDSPNMTWKD